MSSKKSQLLQCVLDLAERAIELKENNIAITLLALYAAGMTNSDATLADWNHLFAIVQLKKFAEEKPKEKLDIPNQADTV